MSKTGGGGSVASRPASRRTKNAAIANVTPRTRSAATQTTPPRYRRTGADSLIAALPDCHVDGPAGAAEAGGRPEEPRITEGEHTAVAGEQPVAGAGPGGADLYRCRRGA